MRYVDITIRGVSPLMLNAIPLGFDPLGAAAKSAIKERPETPRADAERKLYRDAEGRLVFPLANLYSGLIQAGGFQKHGRAKLTTRDSSLVPTGVWLQGQDPLIQPQDWEVDSRPVVNPSTKGRFMAHRPRFDKWELSFTLQHDPVAGFSPKMVRQLVDDLGAKVGIGEFRPARKGPFGRFVVVAWEDRE